MRKISLTLALLAVLVQGFAPAPGWAKEPSVAARDAWRLLSEGNDRFARGMALKPHQDPDRRRSLAKDEEPFAVVVADSDSRATPEFIFDQGLGDLYVVRSAGSAADGDYAIGSIEHAVKHLGARLVVILGSEKSWAVSSALNGMKKDDKSSMDELAARLKPSADEAHDKVGGLKGDDLRAEAEERNVLFQIRNLLKGSPLIAGMVNSGELMVIGGVYSLENGRVRWLGEHPSEKAIIEGKKP
jgi:carbonic anhydrase